MSVLDWIVSIVLFIVSLAILILIHELGHFSMAKLFDVYCHEFSIGFGPALLKKKRKNGETYFAIRAIPLGGYVSMYGEGEELEEGVNIPESRSIEGIKKWKKAIILVAGITLNAVLALVIFAVKDLCFPTIYTTTYATVNETSQLYKDGIRSNDRMLLYKSTAKDADVNYHFSYTIDKKIYEGFFTIVDTSVVMNEKNYVLTYYPQGTKSETKFSDGAHLYPAISKEDVVKDNEYLNCYLSWFTKEGESYIPLEGTPDFFPDFKQDPVQPYSATTCYDTKVFFESSDKIIKEANIHMSTELVEGSQDKYKWCDVGLSFQLIDQWLPFGERVQNVFIDFGNASVAVFRGLGVLFTGGIQNLSGFVGIMKTSAEILGSYTFATYLYFWGLISVNLAVFNLLPFPGLDGFQLLVTAIEGITKKKIPGKFKNIMSIIGLVLLFGLMILVLTFDVLRWIGIMA